jgi:hypothetical protein
LVIKKKQDKNTMVKLHKTRQIEFYNELVADVNRFSLELSFEQSLNYYPADVSLMKFLNAAK